MLNSAEILTLEKTVWDALVNGDPATDRRMLADSFLGVYPSGFANKADHVSQLDDGPTVLSYTLTDARLRTLADGLALLAYRADFIRIDGRQDAMYITSIWEQQNGSWINIFSQDSAADGSS